MFTISSISESDELDSDELVSEELLLDELDSDKLVSEELLPDDELVSDELDSDELVSDELDLDGALVKAVRWFTPNALFEERLWPGWSLSILIIYMLNLITLTEKICKVSDSSL
jgi:hypothetical protein